MNQESPAWLDSLSSGAAPEIPGEVLIALSARRRERHRKLAAGWGGFAAVLVVAGAAWMAYQPVAAPVRAVPVAAGGNVTEPLSASPEQAQRGSVTVASIYGDADGLDLDRLASASPAGEDRQLRIGDHWDPDRVEAWVLD